MQPQSTEQDWPEEFVALLFENNESDTVCVLDAKIVPGNTVPLHTFGRGRMRRRAHIEE